MAVAPAARNDRYSGNGDLQMKSTIYMKPVLCLLILFTCCSLAAIGQTRAAPGQAGFERNCGTCHGGDGFGGEMGPNIANRLPNLTDDQLALLIHEGRPNRGMPGFPNISGQEQTDLMAFLRTIRSRRRAAPARKSVDLQDGQHLSGLVLNESPSISSSGPTMAVCTSFDPLAANTANHVASRLDDIQRRHQRKPL